MAHLQVLVFKWNLDLDTDEAMRIAQRVQNEFIPLLKSKPGFVSYQGFVDTYQPRTSVAVIAWDTAEQAEVALQETAAPTQEIAGRYLVGRETYAGNVILS